MSGRDKRRTERSATADRRTTQTSRDVIEARALIGEAEAYRVAAARVERQFYGGLATLARALALLPDEARLFKFCRDVGDSLDRQAYRLRQFGTRDWAAAPYGVKDGPAVERAGLKEVRARQHAFTVEAEIHGFIHTIVIAFIKSLLIKKCCVIFSAAIMRAACLPVSLGSRKSRT